MYIFKAPISIINDFQNLVSQSEDLGENVRIESVEYPNGDMQSKARLTFEFVRLPIAEQKKRISQLKILYPKAQFLNP